MNTIAATSMQMPAVMAGLANHAPLRIEGASIEPLAGRLEDPFVIASDSSKREKVENVFVRIDVGRGVVGMGEAAPFKGIAGDSFELLRNDLKDAIGFLSGRELAPLEFSFALKDAATFPASRAALEMAFLDACARMQKRALFEFLKPDAQARSLTTDITVPIVEPARALRLAARYRDEGFCRIKVKVGDAVEDAFNRVEAIVGAFAVKQLDCILEILLDANEGYSPDDAVLLSWMLDDRLDVNPVIFEQPVGRSDLEGMRQVRDAVGLYGTKVFADESVFTVRDVARLAEAQAADGINLKLMKHGGIINSLRVADFASRAGLELMVGGMLETNLAMTAALHLAQLIDPVWLDLDTPMLMDVRRLRGGMFYDGAAAMLPLSSGLGVEYINGI